MSVHRYLRAVGFSNIEKREQLQEIIGEVVTKTVLQETRPEMEQSICQLGHHATKDFVADGNDRLYAELCLDFAKDAGICVRGEVDQKNVFLYEYYFPYLKGSRISSNEDVTVERHAEKESYMEQYFADKRSMKLRL